MHLWAAGIQVRAGIMHCNGCGLNFCAECHSNFHTDGNLLGNKSRHERKHVKLKDQQKKKRRLSAGSSAAGGR